MNAQQFIEYMFITIVLIYLAYKVCQQETSDLHAIQIVYAALQSEKSDYPKLESAQQIFANKQLFIKLLSELLLLVTLALSQILTLCPTSITKTQIWLFKPRFRLILPILKVQPSQEERCQLELKQIDEWSLCSDIESDDDFFSVDDFSDEELDEEFFCIDDFSDNEEDLNEFCSVGDFSDDEEDLDDFFSVKSDNFSDEVLDDDFLSIDSNHFRIEEEINDFLMVDEFSDDEETEFCGVNGFSDEEEDTADFLSDLSDSEMDAFFSVDCDKENFLDNLPSNTGDEILQMPDFKVIEFLDNQEEVKRRIEHYRDIIEELRKRDPLRLEGCRGTWGWTMTDLDRCGQHLLGH